MNKNEMINEIHDSLKNDFPFSGYVETASEMGKHVAEYFLNNIPRGSYVLDFGSGPCDKTALLSRLGYKCCACDDLGDEWHKEGNNRELILSFAKKENIEFKFMNDKEVPKYNSNLFDAVLVLDVIEHWPHSPRKLLNYLIDVLKTDGYLIVGMPNSVNIRKRMSVLMGKTNYCSLESFYYCDEPWRGHVREYTKREAEKLLQYQGLEIIHSECVNTILHKHGQLQNRYIRLSYKMLTDLFQTLRDSFVVIGKKPINWKPVLYNPNLASKYIKKPTIANPERTTSTD